MHFLLPTLALTSYIAVKKQEMAHAAAPSKAEDGKGNKENKIRFFGTPKQIYTTFASQEDDNGFLAMSYEEFFKALCPYNYQKSSETSQYFKDHEKSIEKILV